MSKPLFEAADALGSRPFAGVHILASAMLCAKGSSPEELELARILLSRDPEHDAPREAESVAGCFNRHMDAAIESCNASAHAASRVTRRAKLAQDLDRADLVLLDRVMVAALIEKIHERDREIGELRAPIEICATAEHDGHDLGAELATSATSGLGSVPTPTSGSIVGLEFQTGCSFALAHSPSFDVATASSSADVGGCEDPSVVND